MLIGRKRKGCSPFVCCLVMVALAGKVSAQDVSGDGLPSLMAPELPPLAADGSMQASVEGTESQAYQSQYIAFQSGELIEAARVTGDEQADDLAMEVFSRSVWFFDTSSQNFALYPVYFYESGWPPFAGVYNYDSEQAIAYFIGLYTEDEGSSYPGYILGAIDFSTGEPVAEMHFALGDYVWADFEQDLSLAFDRASYHYWMKSTVYQIQ